MSVSKLVKWFASESGRTLSGVGVCAVGVGLASIHLFPHSLLLDKYREYVQMYKFGLPISVPKKILERIENVMQDMKIPDLEKGTIKPFTVFGLDIYHAGSTHNRNGALLGIPSNFNYETIEDVDKANINVNNESVAWSKPAAQELLSSLVLSEKAQKFAIGREISMLRTFYVYQNAAYPSGCIVFLYVLSRYYNDKLKLFDKPIIYRGVLYTILGLFSFGMWALLKDYSTVNREIMADKTICDLGEEYMEGGVEFYSKILQRNKALRELMGSAGEKIYTVTGNEQFLIRNKRVPILHRKEYTETRLKQNNEEKTSQQSNTKVDQSGGSEVSKKQTLVNLELHQDKKAKEQAA